MKKPHASVKMVAKLTRLSVAHSAGLSEPIIIIIIIIIIIEGAASKKETNQRTLSHLLGGGWLLFCVVV